MTLRRRSSRCGGSRNVSAETLRAVLLDAPTVGPREHEHAVVGRLQTVATFVHEAVVVDMQRVTLQRLQRLFIS